MSVTEAVRKKREEVCLSHMELENEHAFDRCIAAFKHARYEIVPTGEIYDGASEVDRLLRENKSAFSDFKFDVKELHHADQSIVVEGVFRGTHDGTWRGLPATGRQVAVPMIVIFRFDGVAMMGERVFFDLATILRQLGVARDPNSTSGRIATVLNHPLTLSMALLRKLFR